MPSLGAGLVGAHIASVAMGRHLSNRSFTVLDVKSDGRQPVDVQHIACGAQEAIEPFLEPERFTGAEATF